MDVPTTRRGQRVLALFVVAALLAPLSVLPAYAQIFTRKPQQPAAPKQGMSTKKKVLLLGGAALLYYLYRKHQAKVAAQAPPPSQQPGSAPARTAANPQLYRSKNGGIYYRDAQGKPVWLTVPQQSVEVPAEEVQRYAPDYTRYRGTAPAAPSGYRTQPFNQFDNSLMSAPAGPRGPR